jgi:hypothetical protein
MKKIEANTIVIRTMIDETKREVHLIPMLMEPGASSPINGVRNHKGLNLWGLKVSGFMYSYDAMFIGFDGARFIGNVHMDERDLTAALKAMKKVNAALREHQPRSMGEALIAMADGLAAEYSIHSVGDTPTSTYADMRWERSAFYREAQRIDGIVKAWEERDRADRAARNVEAA